MLRLELIESVVQVYGGRAGPPPLPPIGLCSRVRESRPLQVASSSVRTCLLADVLMTDGIPLGATNALSRHASLPQRWQ